MGGLSSHLGPLCAVLGRSWGLCWRSGGALGTYFVDVFFLLYFRWTVDRNVDRQHVVGLGAVLGPMLAILGLYGRSWAALGAYVGGLGCTWAALGAYVGDLGPLLSPLPSPSGLVGAKAGSALILFFAL